jgi:hypothetical protein
VVSSHVPLYAELKERGRATRHRPIFLYECETQSWVTKAGRGRCEKRANLRNSSEWEGELDVDTATARLDLDRSLFDVHQHARAGFNSLHPADA